MKKLLQQDDCAPDSLDYFIKQLKETTGITMQELIKKATRKTENDGMTMQWHYSNWILEFSGDDPFYILYEIEQENKSLKKEEKYDKEEIRKFIKEFIGLAVLNIAGEDLPAEKLHQFEINFEKQWNAQFGEK